MTIPISRVELGADVEESVLRVLRSGQIAQGPEVAKFEAMFADAHQCRHAIAVANGTLALIAALRSLHLEPGDEVITSPFTFVATVNAAIECGLTVRFADIGDDYCLDPQSVPSVLGSRSKVLLPVHLYGLTANMGALARIADHNNLAIVEDAAQAHLAKFGGRFVGSWGTACYSLYATKNLSTGEGGVVTTNNDETARWLRTFRNQGMVERYVYEMSGLNYRMTDLQAAIGCVQLPKLADWTRARQENAKFYNENLKGVTGIVLPDSDGEREHVFHQYTIRVTRQAKKNREELAAVLNEAGIGYGFYYPRLVTDYSCFAGHPQVRLDSTPYARAISEETISIPVHQYLSSAEKEKVVSTIVNAM